MDFNEYQQLSRRTIPTVSNKSEYEKLASNFALGAVCEAAEAGDHIKKFAHQGHEIDREKVKEEIGDSLFYLAGIATLFGFTLEEAAKGNIEKLEKRYPTGFSAEASIKRVDVK